MPGSYRPPIRRDAQEKTVSQSRDSNLSASEATVEKLIASKGDKIFSIRPQDTLRTAVEVLRDQRIGALLVTDATGKLLGILSERDIVRKLAETPGKTLPQMVEEVMTTKVETCTPDEPLVSVLRRMTNGRFRHMPVESEGHLMGILTIGDVVNFRLNELEHQALQLKQLIVG